MRTVAIIQARMGSSRLPGKVLMNLCGKPVLWHIVKRLKQCSNLNDIVVATSTTEADTAIVKFCKRYKIKFFRGSESDVLGRYIDAADNFKADYIVRITGDAPLIEPREIDRFIKIMTGK
ncbi:MAG: NTP transferase domain-containing protein, partial [Candidatus Aureabacteria bacterium]|nr:NTP transferase domain-containing protein [Candidatus Auribacterota bacterium]